MKIHDISRPLAPGMVVWEGDPAFRLERFASISAGHEANVSQLTCSVHAGTHIDAPVHFIDGAPSAADIPLDALLGPATVVDARAAPADFDASTLAGLRIRDGSVRVLLKTRNAALWDNPSFDPRFVGVTEDGARWLVERGVRLVGIDYLSIAPRARPVETHRVLLAAGVVILEGLDLRAVEPGDYELVCLPLRLVGADGAPCRAVLVAR